MEYMSIPIITILCYLIGEVIKLLILRKKKRYKYIPILVGSIGGALGLMIYYVSPEIVLGTTNPFMAIAVGIVSGLASTGGNEIIKQMIKNINKKEKNENGK